MTYILQPPEVLTYFMISIKSLNLTNTSFRHNTGLWKKTS